jgi:hypothetical protein
MRIIALRARLEDLANLAFSASRTERLERISKDSRTFISTSALCLPAPLLAKAATSALL